MRKLLLTIISLSFINLSGCSHFGIYRPDIEQGNVYTQPQVAKLRPGMSKQDVQMVMGDAVLVDTFDDNRWTYVYTFQRDGGSIAKKSVTLNFHNNRLTNIESNPPKSKPPLL